MIPKPRPQLETAEARAGYGDLCIIACTPEEDRTRQEFRESVDVNTIIRNLTGYPQSAPTYGEVDFDHLDRHTVELQLASARELYASLTPEQRSAIPSLAHLIQMASDGFEPSPVPAAVPEELGETPPVVR